jgi:O-6-methylguanine DNA methyltransferase
MNNHYIGCTTTPFGLCWVGWREYHILWINFDEMINDPTWLKAINFDCLEAIRDDARASEIVNKLLLNSLQPYILVLNGTPFQKQVWQFLLTIPAGITLSYRQVAQSINKPSSVRAVANAIGANKIAIGVPCHRVIASSGGMSGYRWGKDRKLLLLEYEKSQKKL